MRKTRSPSALAAALSIAGCSHQAPAPTPTVVEAPSIVESDASARSAAPARAARPAVTPVRIDLFVMSKCPYGTAMENSFGTLMKSFGDAVDLHVEYIGNGTVTKGFTSLRGPDEVTGDLHQVCAKAHDAKWFDTILCQNKALDRIATSWSGCAEQAGVDADTIAAVTKCATGPEGRDLLERSFGLARERDVRGSPTLFIAGTEYEGGREERKLTHAICNAFDGAKPEICASIPPAPAVAVTLLGDRRCSECDVDRLDRTLHQRIENPVVTKRDYADPDGAALYAAIAPTKLPAMIFDASLDADPDASRAFASSLKTAGDLRVLSAGDWLPVCADPGGCKLAECAQTLECRVDEPKTIDLYMMGRCPMPAKGSRRSAR